MNLAISIIVFHTALVAGLTFGFWRATRRSHVRLGTESPMISVVIAARNESQNVRNVLNDLAKQTYRNFEIILIDDGSDDNTYDIVRENFPQVRVEKNQGEGKKRALTQGVGVAQGKLVALTDADCRVGADWLAALSQTFEDASANFAFGAVAIKGADFFSRLQSLEFSSVIATGIATSGLGVPTMCNGANLAFRKTVFDQVQGYLDNEHIASGDDEFLMRKVLKKYPGSVRFIGEQSALVTTAPQPSLKSFFSQRFRWAAKWRFNTSATAVLLGLFVFAVQCCILIINISLLTAFSSTALYVTLARCVVEAVFLATASRWMRQRFSPIYFLLLQAIYPFYVIFVAIACNFVPNSWKGRPIRH